MDFQSQKCGNEPYLKGVITGLEWQLNSLQFKLNEAINDLDICKELLSFCIKSPGLPLDLNMKIQWFLERLENDKNR